MPTNNEDDLILERKTASPKKWNEGNLTQEIKKFSPKKCWKHIFKAAPWILYSENAIIKVGLEYYRLLVPEPNISIKKYLWNRQDTHIASSVWPYGEKQKERDTMDTMDTMDTTEEAANAVELTANITGQQSHSLPGIGI